MIKNTKKYWYSVLVVFILIIGFLVRWWNIDKSPASVGYDEAALGYNAYSILKTGKDEYGTFLPLTLRSFNDFKPALYSYLSIPFVAIMGLTAESTRMVSILAGTVSLIFLYLLLRRFVGNKYYCLFLLFIFTFEPWGLHYSRTAFETNLSAAFFISAMWLMFKFSEKKLNLKHVATMLILLAMSIYSYHSARVAAPAIILLWALDPITWLYEKNFIKTAIGSVAKNKNKVAVLMVLILLSVPIFSAGNSSLVLTRLKQENVFERYYPFAPKELISGNPLLSWKSNPIYYLGGMLSGRLLSNVSPVNLSQRIFDWVKLSAQSTADLGVFGWIEGILFAVGLVNVIGNIKKNIDNRILIYWIAAGTIPAAVTWEWFHPLRSLNLFPTLEIIMAIGFAVLVNNILRTKSIFGKVGAGVLMVMLLLESVLAVNTELVYSVKTTSGEYQPGGFKEGVPLLKELQGKYDQIIIDSPQAQSYIFFLFYQQFPPELFQSYASLRPDGNIHGNLDFDFWKYKFRKFDWPKDKNLRNTIFWTSSEVVDDEILREPGTHIYKINNALYQASTIITRE